MAQLPSNRRFTLEDFKTQSPWIAKLISPLNDFISAVILAMDNKLDIQNNLFMELKELDFVVQASGTYPIRFKTKFNSKPVALLVGNVQEVSGNPSVITSAVFADWSHMNQVININNLSGLTTGKRYRVTLIVSYG